MARLRGGRLWPEKVLAGAPDLSEGGRSGVRPPASPEELTERDPATSLDPDPASPDDL